LIEYDTLITVPSIPKGADWCEFVTEVSKFETFAYADPNLLSLKKGDQFQLERIGYFILDSEGSLPLTLVQTPDGHQKNKFLSKKVNERNIIQS